MENWMEPLVYDWYAPSICVVFLYCLQPIYKDSTGSYNFKVQISYITQRVNTAKCQYINDWAAIFKESKGVYKCQNQNETEPNTT